VMDTVCHIGSFDVTGMGTKPQAKIAVMASSYVPNYGAYDADSLFSALNCSVPVIYPLYSMIDEALSGKGDGAVIGIISTEEKLSDVGYSAVVQERARLLGKKGVECVAFPSDTTLNDALIAFLDNYISAGYTFKLDALLIDDLALDASAMRDRLSFMRADLTGDNETYGNMLSKNFEIVDLRQTVASEIYRLMRERNLFTHQISRPEFSDFQAIESDSTTVTLSKYKLQDE